MVSGKSQSDIILRLRFDPLSRREHVLTFYEGLTGTSSIPGTSLMPPISESPTSFESLCV